MIIDPTFVAITAVFMIGYLWGCLTTYFSFIFTEEVD